MIIQNIVFVKTVNSERSSFLIWIQKQFANCAITKKNVPSGRERLLIMRENG